MGKQSIAQECKKAWWLCKVPEIGEWAMVSELSRRIESHVDSLIMVCEDSYFK
jgi:hypothetical protein